jgi:hypothetical protein
VAEKVERVLEERINRGRERLEAIATQRDEAYEFYRGNHYAYVDERGVLQVQATTTSVRGTGKPRWRARQRRNLIFDIVLRETSASTQRIPSYQVVPSTADPDDISAARLAEKLLIYGYERWRIRQATVNAVIHAIVGGEAFAWPYFDNTIGPFIPDMSGGAVGMGDIRVAVFGPNECYWEPGLRFEKSPWHVVEQAQPISEIEELPGYVGGSLTPDASSRALSMRRSGSKPKLALVTNYLERPCPRYPEGRWITLANKRRIVEDRAYPGTGQEPILRKLSYAPDPDSDRDLGLVAQIIDGQRTFNDANNKAVEWKNLCLMPQFAVAPGLMDKQRRTDEPGKIYEIPQPNENLKVIEPPQVPNELFEMADRAQADMGRIAAQNDIPSQVESGRGIQALLESDSQRRASFITGLAEWYSGIGHDSLVLAQQHYTEERLIQIKGDFGWESIADFRGAQLRDQVDARVFPRSIEPQTREGMEQQIMNYANLGWIGPEAAMSAIQSGSVDQMLRSLNQDEGRVGRVIQRIKEGPEALFAMPEIPTGRLAPAGPPDPMTGVPPQAPETAPGWMPRWADNLGVWRTTLEDWMKTEEFERLLPPQQEAASLVYGKILELEQAKAQEAQMQQMAQAEQMGMDNAARPQGAKPLPSLPSLSSSNGENQQTPG